MPWFSSAIAAAELRAVRSRHEMHAGFRRLRSRLSSPPGLVAAAMLGAYLGRKRPGAVAGVLATSLIRFVVKRLLAAGGGYRPSSSPAGFSGSIRSNTTLAMATSGAPSSSPHTPHSQPKNSKAINSTAAFTRANRL